MSTALILTADIQAADKLAEELLKIRFRSRVVAASQAAVDWLSMQEFTALVIDSRYPNERILEVLIAGWKHHPLLAGCIFSEHELDEEPRSLSTLGAQVFSGPSMMQQMMQFLKNLPEAFALGEHSHFAVLVVEDLDSPRDIICAYVESLGFSTVDQAKSAAQAMELLERDPYRYFCVITDILMPEQSGVELLQRIRSSKEELINALPVVILTSAPSPEHLRDCIRFGASGFLVKPPKKNQLRHELEKAKRTTLMKLSPRLCEESDAEMFEHSLDKLLKGRL